MLFFLVLLWNYLCETDRLLFGFGAGDGPQGLKYTSHSVLTTEPHPQSCPTGFPSGKSWVVECTFQPIPEGLANPSSGCFSSFFFLAVLELELGAPHLLDRCSTT
jgi:hypothetical protein